MAMNPRLLRPLATGFNPRSIAGLGLWFDAADSSTITLNGSTVSVWRDKSGAGRDATQPTAANQPAYSNTLNGKPVVTISSSVPANIFSTNVPSASAITIFAALRRIGSPNRYISLGVTSISEGFGVGLTGWIPLIGFNDANHGGFAESALRSALPGGLTNSEAAVISATHNGTDILNYKNGVAGSSASVVGLSASFERLWIGGRTDVATETANADIGEVLFYSRLLTASERQRVEQYLGRKWGIAVT